MVVLVHGLSAVVSGMFSEDKLNQLTGWWAIHVDNCYPDMNFGAQSGLAAHAALASQSTGEVVFAAPARRLSSKTPSEPKGPVLPAGPADTPLGSFKVGDVVCLRRRISPLMPLPDNPNFRKGLRDGG